MNPLLATMHPDELKLIMTSLGFESYREMSDAIGVCASTPYFWMTGRSSVPRPMAMLLRILAQQPERIAA